jgi:hypothetical protein
LTHPKLEATVITRFREKVPKELYRDFNEAKKVVTCLNGATTQFGSMQYEHNAWDWQGQWFKIGYDELAEFTFTQWNATAAWNRCPVSPYCTKDGATNPIGVGAGWIKKLFIDKKPCDEMDEHQRRQYTAEDYEYFPCTYLDNPIYANDALGNLANLSIGCHDVSAHRARPPYFAAQSDPDTAVAAGGDMPCSAAVSPEPEAQTWLAYSSRSLRCPV